MKTTFRLPDPLFEELRSRSRQEGQSLNATAIDTLWRGLGINPIDRDLSTVLGSLIAERATAAYQPNLVEERLATLRQNARDLSEPLDWARADR